MPSKQQILCAWLAPFGISNKLARYQTATLGILLFDGIHALAKKKPFHFIHNFSGIVKLVSATKTRQLFDPMFVVINHYTGGLSNKCLSFDKPLLFEVVSKDCCYSIC